VLENGQLLATLSSRLSLIITEMITLKCPCGAKFRVKDKIVGKRVKCSKCGIVFEAKQEMMEPQPVEKPSSDVLRDHESEAMPDFYGEEKKNLDSYIDLVDAVPRCEHSIPMP